MSEFWSHDVRESDAALKAELGRSNDLLASLQEYITEYLGGYEVRSDEGDYMPNDRELFLIYDAIQGLLSEDEFLQKIKAWIDSRH